MAKRGKSSGAMQRLGHGPGVCNKLPGVASMVQLGKCAKHEQCKGCPWRTLCWGSTYRVSQEPLFRAECVCSRPQGGSSMPRSFRYRYNALSGQQARRAHGITSIVNDLGT